MHVSLTDNEMSEYKGENEDYIVTSWSCWVSDKPWTKVCSLLLLLQNQNTKAMAAIITAIIANGGRILEIQGGLLPSSSLELFASSTPCPVGFGLAVGRPDSELSLSAACIGETQ